MPTNIWNQQRQLEQICGIKIIQFLSTKLLQETACITVS